MKNIVYILRYAYHIDKKILPLFILQQVIEISSNMVYLFFPKLIVDEIFGEGRLQYILVILIALSIILLVITLMKNFINKIISKSKDAFEKKQEHYFAQHAIKLKYTHIESKEVQDLCERAVRNVNVLEIITSTIGGIGTIGTLLVVVGLITNLNPLLLMVVVMTVFINVLVGTRLKVIAFETGQQTAIYSRRIQYTNKLMLNWEYAKEIRINSLHAFLQEKWNEEYKEYTKFCTKRTNKYYNYMYITRILDSVQYFFIYGLLAYYVVYRNLSMGDFILYTGATTQVKDGLTNLINYWRDIQLKAAFIDSFRAYFNLEEEVKDGILNVQHILQEAQNIEIEFKDVGFKYPKMEQYVLRNVSCKIANGEKISIVGANGAGKTTFIKLLCRFYEPTEGTILINGVSIGEIKLEEYYKLLSVVFQDYKLFPFSVRDNVVLGNSLDSERVQEAIDIAGLKNKFLHRGLDTTIYKILDEEGIEFSGGEGQKLVIARTWYKDAPIVILDEPTAALDPISEYEMYKHFNEFVGKKTTIFVSHRLASCKFCDKVFVFDKNTIVEEGTHQALMVKDGLYAAMFSKQAKFYT
ncbi:MAG: ABC transporter ATP-binding protein [Niameybacter sp.]|uniref:ABC transporter ATP-binding protein n=1 Tax=Niameybacter sp. TaxID=2033640 RepID=UPI002FC79CC5